MMKRLMSTVIGLFIIGSGVTVAAAIPSQTVSAEGCTTRFLTFPAWFDGLTKGDCTLKTPGSDKDGTQLGTFIWRIVLNIINIGLQIIAYASAGYLIYGGFKYLTSSGLPDKATAARKTILNAIIGLVLSFFSVVVVTLVAGNIQ